MTQQFDCYRFRRTAGRCAVGFAVLPLLISTGLVVSPPCVSVVFAQAARPPAAPASFQDEWPFGFQLFHLLLEQNGLKTVRELPVRGTERPAETVIVVVGALRQVSPSRWAAIRTVLLNGGAVLIASDERAAGADLFRFEGGPIEVADEQFRYQGFADCPRITDLDTRHPLTRGVTELIANRAGWVETPGRSFAPCRALARLPRSARTRDGRGASMPLIAAAEGLGRRQQGRLVEIADHSLLINGMLWHGDNALFAMNLADWLCEGNRRQLLFLVDGAPVQDQAGRFNPSLPDVPPELPPDFPPGLPPESIPPLAFDDLSKLPPETLITFANHFVTGLEDADVPNELAAGRPAEISDGVFRQRLFLTLAILAGLFLVRQSLRSGTAPIERAAARTALSGTAARVQELVRARDLRPACRELTRDLFRQLTGSDNPVEWKIRPADVQVAGGPLKRYLVGSSLQYLKAIATDAARDRMTLRQFKSVARQVERIHQLHRERRISHPWISTTQN